MTIQERINLFCTKHPEPRQYKFDLYWNRKDGKHTETVGSGSDLIWYGETKVSRSCGSPFYMQHYLWDDEVKMMECSYIVFDCHVPKKDKAHKWEYAERYFLPQEEKVLYDVNGRTGNYLIHASYPSTVRNARVFLQGFIRCQCPKGSFEPEYIELASGRRCVPPRYENSKWPWVLTEYIKYVDKSAEYGKNSPLQQKIDKLTEKPLPDIDIYDALNKNALTTDYYINKYSGAWFDKENNVFRIFSLIFNKVKEIKRVYNTKSGFIVARNDNGKWVKNGSFTYSNFCCNILNMCDLLSMEHCAYLECVEHKRVYDVVSTMRNPEIEQIYNMGFRRLANKLSNCQYGLSISGNIKSALGEINDKKKRSILQKYHITKKQLEIVDKNIDRYSNLPKMRKIFGDNLSNIDVDSFEKYYKAMYQIDSYELNMFDTEHGKEMFMRLAKMKQSDAMRTFRDTYSLYRYMNHANIPDIDIWGLHKYDDIVRAHDMLVEIKRIEDEERRRLNAMREEERNKALEKKMAKLDEERKKLNYEDDNFIIRIPNKMSEIVSEGHDLHHCVGGYTQNHANGSTTILFLRRKSDPDKSFYTIELRGSDIVQIHGFGNKWLGNDVDAIPTVARWLKEKNISCSQQILRGTSHGYSCNGMMVPMPEI